MGRDARLARPLITNPRQDRVIDFESISKRQLANALNEQTANFQRIRHQNQVLIRILIAALKDRDALRAHPGSLTLEKLAFDTVTSGEAITIAEEEAVIRIRLSETAPSALTETLAVPSVN